MAAGLPDVVAVSAVDRRVVAADDLEDEVLHAGGLEGVAQGGQLVEHAAEGPQVGPGQGARIKPTCCCRACSRRSPDSGSKGFLMDFVTTKVGEIPPMQVLA